MDVGVLIGLNVLAIAILGIVGIVVAVIGWDRYHSGRPPQGSNPNMRPTTEMFVDPVSKHRQRVWSDPTTGEREYRGE